MLYDTKIHVLIRCNTPYIYVIQDYRREFYGYTVIPLCPRTGERLDNLALLSVSYSYGGSATSSHCAANLLSFSLVVPLLLSILVALFLLPVVLLFRANAPYHSALSDFHRTAYSLARHYNDGASVNTRLSRVPEHQ
jgi:hypothetical protein